MNRYDKDMMHERELIYDAKQQEKHGGSKKHDEELIYDAKGEIHNEDVAKHREQHGYHASANKVLKHSRKNRS